jgi:hypothetical protein
VTLTHQPNRGGRCERRRIAFRDLRRGEACGARWVDGELDEGLPATAKQLTNVGREAKEGSPKTESSDAVVALDKVTVAVLRAHKARQNEERLAWGPAWNDTGRIFTREDGSELTPDWVSEHFERLTFAPGLPPAARPSPRRRHAVPGGGQRHEDDVGDAAVLERVDHGRSLYDGAAGSGRSECRSGASGCRGGGRPSASIWRPDRRQAAEAGAFLAFGGPSRVHHATDWRLLGSLAALADAGHAHQILFGADTVTPTARSSGDGPGMPFLLRGLRPRIERELGPDLGSAIFIENPARAFAVRWRQP